MINKTYSLATRAEADCDQPTVGNPINNLTPGDVVVSGFGTLTWHFNEVVEVKHVTNSNCFKATFADGHSTVDSANGFWYAVIKADPESQEAAAKFATAYAVAWDRRR